MSHTIRTKPDYTKPDHVYKSIPGLTNSTPRDVAQMLFSHAAGDIKARMIINRAGELLLKEAYDENSRPKKAALCSLMHALAYLADRGAYERAPWPKNKFKIALPSTPTDGASEESFVSTEGQ